MAQYKVPQDVEADDKLLGPFSFRQFVYLLIAAGLIALAVALFQIFPLLAIIPLPPVLLLGALALPLKKDQPMETYLAAIVSYLLKPRTRTWNPGQRESTILITAPKITDDNKPRTRDISGEEATHRLSFLADIVDTEGYAIKGASASSMRDDLVAEANATNDMFESNHFDTLGATIMQDEKNRHDEVMQEMREAIDKAESMNATGRIVGHETRKPEELISKIEYTSPVVVMPEAPTVEKPVENYVGNLDDSKHKDDLPNLPKPGIMELANNPDFSVETIAKQAKRIKERDEGEVFISLR